MIEQKLREFLETKLEYPVTFEVQKRPPAKYYILEKTGGSLEDYISDSVFTLQSYADSLVDAMEMNSAAKAAMLSAMELDIICKVSLNSDYNFTDTDQKKYRYQAVFDVKHY